MWEEKKLMEGPVLNFWTENGLDSTQSVSRKKKKKVIWNKNVENIRYRQWMVTDTSTPETSAVLQWSSWVLLKVKCPALSLFRSTAAVMSAKNWCWDLKLEKLLPLHQARCNRRFSLEQCSGISLFICGLLCPKWSDRAHQFCCYVMLFKKWLCSCACVSDQSVQLSFW